MTSILIDTYKSKTFVFSDGRATAGSSLITNTNVKSHKNSDGTVLASCGTSGILEEAVGLYECNSLTKKNIQALWGSGKIILVKETEHIVYTFNSNEPTTNVANYHKHSSGMRAYGSGAESLRAVYKALKISSATSLDEYHKLVREAFSIVSECEISCGELLTTETVG